MKGSLRGELDRVAGPERRGGNAQLLDLVDPVGSVAGTVRSFGVQEQPTSGAPTQRVRLDQAPAAVVTEFHAEMVGSGEPHGFEGYPDSPGCDRGRR